MALLTPEDLRPLGEADDSASLQGVPLRGWTDDDLTEAIAEAEDAINAFFELSDLDSILFNHYSELQNWDGEYSLTPYRGPLRAVQGIKIVTMISPTGVEQGIDLSPTEFQIDRDTNTGQAQTIILFLQGIPIFSYIEPKFRLEYTAGYDDGTQNDGVVLPPPRRLLSACRIIVADILRDWLRDRNLKGMTNVFRLSTGGADVAMQRTVAQKTGAETAVPARARDLLLSLHQVQRAYIGSSD